MNKLILVVLAVLFAGSANAAILCESLSGGSPYIPATLEIARTSNSCRNTSVVVTSALTSAQSNITAAWPSDRGLEIRFGGSLANSTEFAFTDGRVFTCGEYHAFKGAGAVLFGNGSRVSVQWFGTKADNTTDDTEAIQRAIASITGWSVARFSLDGGIGRDSNIATGQMSEIFFPNGRYLISGELVFPDNCNIVGDGAYIHSESTTDALFQISTIHTTVKGFVFDGGKYHIHCYSAIRTEAAWVEISQCDFRHATTRAIFVDRTKITSNGVSSPGYPMTLQIHNIRSYGAPFLEAYTNGTFVSDSWIAWDVSADDHDDLPLFVANDKLNLTNILEVPFGTNANRTPRISSSGGAPLGGDDPLFCVLKNVRFGGEATQTPIARLKDKGSGLVMDGCNLFGAAGGYWLEIDKAPEYISVKNVLGGATGVLTNTWGIFVNSANITSTADLVNYSRIDIDIHATAQGSRIFYFGTDRTTQTGAVAFNYMPEQSQSGTKDAADIVLANYVPGDGLTWWAAPYVATSKGGVGGFAGTEDVLGYTLGYLTSTANGWYVNMSAGGFVAPAAGVYTYSCWIKTSGKAIASFQDTATTGLRTHQQELQKGLNFFTARFYHDGVTTTSPTIAISGADVGNRIVIGLFAIHQGAVAGRWQSPNSSGVPMLSRHFYAAAVPTTGTWRRGDIVWNTAPAAAGIPGWICTTAGTPGTWKAMAVLAL